MECKLHEVACFDRSQYQVFLHMDPVSGVSSWPHLLSTPIVDCVVSACSTEQVLGKGRQ